MDLVLAQKWNYVFAAKLVRGAYMEQERRLAREKGYEDPINATFEATSTVYHSCLDEVFTHMLQRPSGQIRNHGGLTQRRDDSIRHSEVNQKGITPFESSPFPPVQNERSSHPTWLIVGVLRLSLWHE